MFVITIVWSTNGYKKVPTFNKHAISPSFYAVISPDMYTRRETAGNDNSASEIGYMCIVLRLLSTSIVAQQSTH